MNYDEKQYNKKVREEMLKVLIHKGKQISVQYPIDNYKLILSEFWNMEEDYNIQNGTWALNEYKQLYEDEIESEEEVNEKPKKYGLGLFGTILAAIIGIVEAFNKKK